MKIFIDVGANKGEVMKVAMEQQYGFDWIYCFEPVDTFIPTLREIADLRCFVYPYGLWNETCRRTVYAAETLGGSIFRDKQSLRMGIEKICQFVRASEWFEDHVVSDDLVIMNLNCEGAECDILDDLMESREIEKLNTVLVDFDVRKIPSQRHREIEVRERLKSFPEVQVLVAEEAAIGRTVSERTNNWLRLA